MNTLCSFLRNAVTSKAARFALLAAILMLIVAAPAYASETATGLEWETPFQQFYRSITGPVAFGIAFLGIVVCGAALVYGGEINEFVRRMVMVILVVAVLMFAGNILRRMFAGGAALITAPEVVEPRNGRLVLEGTGLVPESMLIDRCTP